MNKKKEKNQIDLIDRQILEILNQNGRIKLTTIARSIDRTEGTVRNRIRRLKEKGIIQGFQVVTDTANLGYEKQVIIRFQIEPSYEAYTKMNDLPFVCQGVNCKLMSLYRCNGKSSFMLEVLSRNKQDMEYFVEELSKFKGIKEIEVLSKEKKIYDHIS